MVMPQFGAVPGLPTTPQPFAAPSNFDPQIRQLLAAGVDPRTIRMLGVEGAGSASRGLREAKKGTEGVRQSAQGFLKNYGKYTPLAVGAASLVPGATTALSELEAGRPTGALGALTPGLLSAAGTGLAMAPNPIAKGVGYGLMGLGAILPGAAAAGAEGVRQKVTGTPTKGKEQEFSTQLAMRGQIMNQNLDALNRSAATQLQATKDLTTFYNQAQVNQMKAMAPEIEKAKMNDFARYQTAMALQGQIQGQLGTLATAGALAQGAQAGNYGLAQTAMTTNPYANATLQAPQIRFG